MEKNIINEKNTINSEKEGNNNNNLENIKSKYITQIIFSYVSEKINLKLVQYNKHLQNKMDIKFINYQFFSRKYIIYEQSGIVKEYNKYNDILLYEGEYLNGKRNGKGKEYNDFNGNLIFEGEFLNGNRWNGKGYIGDRILFELKNGRGFLN